MLKKILLLIITLFLLLPAALAQDSENPTIAMLRFGPIESYDIAEGAVLDLLESYGFISTEENRTLEERQKLEGENINIIWGDAGWDLPTIGFMVETALDQEADILVVLGTPAIQLAVNATLNMEDPPIVLFTSSYNPYQAGIAQDTCLKPAHVTGSESITDYDYVFSILLLQDPDMDSIGIIHSSNESSGIVGAQTITALAEARGWSVETVAVATLADLRPAAESLVSKNVSAIVIPVDLLTTAGLPIVAAVANQNGVPIFHSSMGGASLGAAVGAGFYRYYEQGTNVGIMLTAYLNGDIDIATTGISISSDQGTAVNLTMAEQQGIEISDALMAEADLAYEDGEYIKITPDMMESLARSQGVVIPLEDRAEGDQAFLAALQCTGEIIAAQQAELEAAEE